MKTISLFILFLFQLVIFAQEPKGDRMIAWIAETVEGEEYPDALAYASAGCMESVHHFFKWSDLETEPGVFDSTFLSDNLDLVNWFYPLYDLKVEMTIAITNTTAKETPEDLLAVDYDDPTFINRFKTLLDTVFVHISDVDIVVLNIGNETDILFGTDASEYEAYSVFLDSIVPYAKARYNELYSKELSLGATMTLEGLTSPEKGDLCAMLNAHTDIISTTYYPLAFDFTMKDPEVVLEDFDALVEAYADSDQPIFFSECGYASSETCNSSDAQQAQFYSKVFEAWDLHADRIKYLTVFKLTDWTEEDVIEFGEYYGLDDPIFLEYLRTLGLRDEDGNFKVGYDFILCELAARDWCDTECALTEIEENQDQNVLIYPQPASEELTVNVPNQEIRDLKLFDQTGRLVRQVMSSTMLVNELPSGIYIVHVETQTGIVLREKVIVR
jgi:hypothetical protein